MNDLPGFHHYYAGLVLMLIGFICSVRFNSLWYHLITVFGFYVSADDYYQDAIRRKKDPAYHSPLHRFYGATLYKWSALVRWVNYLVDKLFGG